MKKEIKHRAIPKATAMLLAFVLLVSNLQLVYGADSFPHKNMGKAEPTFSGYRVRDVLSWSPETDADAEYLRARVPLQKRNEPFQPTQANPSLDSDAQIMLMQGDYGNSFFDSTMYTDKFSEHVLNFWQYTDYFSPWHGAATSHVPQDLYNPVTSDWRARGFEFGIVNIPNPAYTNAAHKNGVMSIACIYFDPAFRPGQTAKDLVEKDEDGNFTAIGKLIELAEYCGFDGYFLNQEDATEEDFKPFMAALTASGLYTQWYDTISDFNENKAQWLKDDKNGQIHDSVFVNYNWASVYDKAISYAQSIGVDPFKSVFFGVEANQNGFKGGHSSGKVDLLYKPGTKNLRASIALFTPSDYYQRGLDDDVKYRDSDPTPLMQRDEFQWMVMERERMYFSGVKSDPKITGRQDGYARPEVGVSKASGWVGVADFASERSVVNGNAFYTNFNTGHGMQYFKDGKLSADGEWTNINIQDILPSWQWWIDSEGTRLNVDFDYGEKFTRADVNGSIVAPAFKQVGAYEGGSSLVVYGALQGKNNLHLYKTDMHITASSKASITFRKSSEDNAKMSLGLIFKDDPDHAEAVAIADADKKGDWITKELDISAYKGRDLAAITLLVEGNAAAYQMNIGSIKIADKAYKPEKPTGLKADYVYDTGEMIVKWDLADYDSVKQYNLYGKMSDGRRVYLGGIYDDILYVKSIFGEKKNITLELCAVGKDGSESDPATLTYDFQNNVSNIHVDEAKKQLVNGAATPGKLAVSWQAPASGQPSSYNLTVKLREVAADNSANKVYTTTAGGDATTAEIELPFGEGYKYDLSIAAVVNGEARQAISYRGVTNDNYSQPIEKTHIVAYQGTQIRFVDPDSEDWYRLYIYKDDVQQKTITRGGLSSGTRIMSIDMPTGVATIGAELEDFSGNRSQRVNMIAVNGKVFDPQGKISAEQFPDPVLLAAVQKQAGDTVAKVMEYTGNLDLSGTDVADLTGIDLLQNLYGLDLKDCKNLTSLDRAQLEMGSNLKEIDISGCENLETINLSNLNLQKLTGAGTFEKAFTVDLSNNKLDFSEGTPENAFTKAVALVQKKMETRVTEAKETSNIVEGLSSNYPKVADGQWLTGEQIDQITEPILCTFEEAKKIESIVFLGINNEKPMKLNVEISEDGTSFEPLGETTVEGFSKELFLPTPTKIKAIRITCTDKSHESNLSEIMPRGKALIYTDSSLNISAQRPEGIYLPEEKSLELEVPQIEGGEYDLRGYQPVLKTVRGTDFSNLADADFVASDYKEKIKTDIADANIVTAVYNEKGEQVGTDKIRTTENALYSVRYSTAGENPRQLRELVVTVGVLAKEYEAAKAAHQQEEYTAKSWGTLAAALDKAKAATEATEPAVGLISEARKALADAVSGLVKLENIRADAKTQLRAQAENAKAAIDALTALAQEEKAAKKDKVDEAVKQGLEAIDQAVGEETIQTALTTAEEAITAAKDEAVQANLAVLKKNAAAELQAYAENPVKQNINKLEKLTAEEKAALNTRVDAAVQNGLAAIEAITDSNTVADILATAKGNLDKIGKEAVDADAAENTDDTQPLSEHHHAYIQGYPDGTVKPNNDLSRAEAAQMIYNLLAPEQKDAGAYKGNFKDVKPGSWYAKAVSYLESTNLLKGYPDGSFQPNAKITRAEMAVIVSRMENLTVVGNGVTAFSDVSVKSWAYPYIASSYQAGLIQGYTDGTFGPNKNITRAEAITILNRATGRNTSKAELEKYTTSFKDLKPSQWSYPYIMEAANAHDFTRNADGTETWVKENR